MSGNPDDKTRWEWVESGQAQPSHKHGWPTGSTTRTTGQPSPADDRRTRVFAPTPRADESGNEGKTAAVAEDPDLVAGWLVIIKGPGRGTAVQIGIGGNNLGRDTTQRMQVDFGDDMISRVNHATIVYDDRARRFFIQHGGGKNLTRLNGNLVTSLTELSGGDRIELSAATTACFVPFCGEAFDWSDDV